MPRSSLASPLLVAPLLVAAACLPSGGGSETREECLSRTEQGIFGGSPDPSASGLSSQESWAIGALESQYGTLYCTGVVIDPRWVLTAAHCATEDLYLRVAARGAPPLVLALGEVFTHPSVDMALIEVLDPARLVSAGIKPVTPRVTPSIGGIRPGMSVVLAGVGLTEEDDSGELKFVEEEVVTVDVKSITVEGGGKSGACRGDSGGPLMTKSSTGSMEMLGLLTAGAPSCVGRDVYLRLDASSAWLEETLGSLPPVQSPACEPIAATKAPAH